MTATIVSNFAPPTNPAEEQALADARAGRRVFLLSPGSKVPLKNSNGHNDATTDEATIRRWFQQMPAANYGIALDAADLIIDADPRNYPTDRDVLDELLTTWFPGGINTRIISTPRGGYHIHLKKPADLKLKKEQTAFPGIDFLSEGRYICGPGSRTVQGAGTVDGSYVFYRQAGVIADAPAEHLALLDLAATGDATNGVDSPTLSMEQDFINLCREWPPAIEGKGGDNHTLQLAMRGRDCGLTEKIVYQHMLPWNETCQPRWEEADLWKKVKNAFKSAKNALGSRTPEAVFAGAAAPPVPPVAPSAEAKKSTAAEEVYKNIQVLFGESAEFWKDQDGTAYVSLTIHRHKEHYKVTSRDFRLWLHHAYRQRFAKVPSSEYLKNAIEGVEADARFNGMRYEPAVRLGKKDGRIYLDLCNDDWQVVEISQDGWQVLDESPIKFIRTSNMRELPTPQQASPEALLKLRSLLNLPSDNSWALFIGFIFACLNHGAPNPVLVLQGEQGSAKSFHAKIIRRLIDPAEALTCGKLSNEKDLLSNAASGHVLALDNLSYLKNDLSDSICRLATEGGNSFRKLYSDGDLYSFNLTKPIVLTGIESFVTRSDLLSRSIVIELPTIPDKNKLTEEQLSESFEEIKASVLGALLNAVSAALRRFPETNPSPLPRLADMAKFVTAAEPELGLRPGQFLDAYWLNQQEAAGVSLEASPVAQHILSMNLPWEGTADNLRQAITATKGYLDPAVPKTAKAMSDHLRRLSPDLRRVGIDVQFGKRQAKMRPISISQIGGLTWADVL